MCADFLWQIFFAIVWEHQQLKTLGLIFSCTCCSSKIRGYELGASSHLLQNVVLERGECGGWEICEKGIFQFFSQVWKVGERKQVSGAVLMGKTRAIDRGCWHRTGALVFWEKMQPLFIWPLPLSFSFLMYSNFFLLKCTKAWALCGTVYGAANDLLCVVHLIMCFLLYSSTVGLLITSSTNELFRAVVLVGFNISLAKQRAFLNTQ